MSTKKGEGQGKPKPKAKPGPKTGPGSRPARAPVPSGTEVILGTAEAAAALGMGRHNFRKLLHLKQVPEPDGTLPWSGYRFWKQSTINEFIDKLTREDESDGRPEGRD